MSEREIKFEDIRVGDTIRREWKELDVLKTHTGTAARIHRGDFFTEMGATLAFADWRGFTYILVDRPKPPLPTEPGSVIKVTKVGVSDVELIARLDDDGDWGVFCLTGTLGWAWVSPDRINEWHHIEIFEVQP